MEVAIGHGLHALPWREPRPGAHAARAAAFYVWSQVEGGHGCPVSMTYAALPALRNQPELAARWEPLMTSLEYDPGLRPPSDKRGVLFGMAMTESQGGSDVRANTTRADAVDAGGPGGEYFLTGHKWFCSAPMCDAFLVLAQAPGGLSCFMLPRTLDDGERNRFHIQRLKDKLGNRSNASAEILLDGDVGEDVDHQWLLAQQPAKRAAVGCMMRRLRHRLAHERRRADDAIEARVVDHVDDRPHPSPLLADHQRPRAVEQDLG